MLKVLMGDATPKAIRGTQKQEGTPEADLQPRNESSDEDKIQ